jgi:hypothetical protein
MSRVFGTLLMNQNLRIRIRAIQAVGNRILTRVEPSPGKVRQDRQDMRISKKRVKREQLSFYGTPAS